MQTKFKCYMRKLRCVKKQCIRLNISESHITEIKYEYMQSMNQWNELKSYTLMNNLTVMSTVRFSYVCIQYQDISVWILKGFDYVYIINKRNDLTDRRMKWWHKYVLSKEEKIFAYSSKIFCVCITAIFVYIKYI